ncbi:NT-3 growth factor receptor [Saguinus oedipus]|uniref:NT-3 growth factor receptor n=1 Tax=Saguinus oedipus TaxID=9490 RepID=A0ABQ9VGH6_SAGOE|nr:NT-3 growth factor receptor [Saguinus oedipus]
MKTSLPLCWGSGGTSVSLSLFRVGGEELRSPLWLLEGYRRRRETLCPGIQLASLLTDPPRVVSLEEPELRLEHCIEFVVRGNPPPTLHWLHNGQPLRESKIIHVEYYQEGEISEGCLLFNKPTHYNNGNYTLIAKNPLGTANQTINGHFLKEPFPESTDNFILCKSALPVALKLIYSDTIVDEVSPTPPITVTHKPEEDTFGVSIAVGLAAFACVLLVVLFIMINKYGRRSKFGMKGKGLDQREEWGIIALPLRRRTTS